MAAALSKEISKHCCWLIDADWRWVWVPTDYIPQGVQADPSAWTLAAAEARRLRRPHCSIMGLAGTARPRSGPGKDLTRVRSLTSRRPWSQAVLLGCD